MNKWINNETFMHTNFEFFLYYWTNFSEICTHHVKFKKRHFLLDAHVTFPVLAYTIIRPTIKNWIFISYIEKPLVCWWFCSKRKNQFWLLGGYSSANVLRILDVLGRIYSFSFVFVRVRKILFDIRLRKASSCIHTQRKRPFCSDPFVRHVGRVRHRFKIARDASWRIFLSNLIRFWGKWSICYKGNSSLPLKTVKFCWEEYWTIVFSISTWRLDRVYL